MFAVISYVSSININAILKYHIALKLESFKVGYEISSLWNQTGANKTC